MRGICVGGKRESLTTASDKDFAPLPLEGADERSEAGLAFPNVGVPFHAANLRPEGAACIVIGIFEPSLLYPLPHPPTISSSKGV